MATIIIIVGLIATRCRHLDVQNVERESRTEGILL